MPSPSAPRREDAALRGTHLRLGLTAFIVLSVYALAVYHAVEYWRITHDPARVLITATLVRCGSGSPGPCQARFRYAGRPYVVGVIQGRGGQKVTLSIQRADPTAFTDPGGPTSAYGPLVAVVLLTVVALAGWRVYRPRAGAAGPRAPSPESK